MINSLDVKSFLNLWQFEIHCGVCASMKRKKEKKKRKEGESLLALSALRAGPSAQRCRSEHR
jgi:hypothetical protein